MIRKEIGVLYLLMEQLHKSRGKYKIVEDTKNGIYVDKIVDASDIIQVEKK